MSRIRVIFFFLMIRRPPRSTQGVSSAASDVYKRQIIMLPDHINLVMLSASVPNYQEFAQWVGMTKRKPIYIQATTKRPIPLEHYIYIDKKLVLIKDEHENIVESNYSRLQKQLHDKYMKKFKNCLLYTSPSPRDLSTSRMPSSA
eukprot:TRINITY_DN26445_c0_g1_i2.p1 TRINITY_DN26445_c0_g1~~TRINITY_DN26445_c0_g1_i2.p1  ORF type:complete len:145 (+),score=33.75 TRINITY_DN26445_c0_g1_i2:79-513(+)